MSMAAVGSTTTSGWWRPRVWLAALAVSAALNLCFVAGAVWTRMHPPPSIPTWQERFREMRTELDLTPQQVAGFDHYLAAMRTRVETMHRQTEPLIAAAWQEMAKPGANPAQVQHLFAEAAEKRLGFQRDVATQTLNFLSLLAPTQRSKFIAIAGERRASRLHRHLQQR